MARAPQKPTKQAAAKKAAGKRTSAPSLFANESVPHLRDGVQALCDPPLSANSDKSSLPLFESEGGGAVPPLATHLRFRGVKKHNPTYKRSRAR